MNRKNLVKLFCLLSCFFFQNTVMQAQTKGGEFVIRFQHKVKNQALHVRDSFYTNAFGEQYQVTRLKYYISNIHLASGDKHDAVKNVSLVDANLDDSITVNSPAGTYQKLVFTLGLDSALNNSGAQEGVLDPLNGMFWTWNSGYVYFKLEGFSTASTADLQRIEHHIGGYIGLNIASRQIEIKLPTPLVVRDGDHQSITIRLDLDKYWKGRNDIRIASDALIMVPGSLAVKSADNFEGLFSIIEVK